jgi:hypothetical protein
MVMTGKHDPAKSEWLIEAAGEAWPASEMSVWDTMEATTSLVGTGADELWLATPA